MSDRRNGSRAEDPQRTPTKRPPPPARRSSRPPASGTKEYRPLPTLSVATVALGDIPLIVPGGTALEVQAATALLVANIDGASTVAELADRSKLEPEQARAIVAELVHKGLVSLTRKPASASGVGAVRSAPKSLDYWLAGLKPRTK
jgi:hypothetical protein